MLKHPHNNEATIDGCRENGRGVDAAASGAPISTGALEEHRSSARRPLPQEFRNSCSPSSEPQGLFDAHSTPPLANDKALAHRFWAKVRKTRTCWLWTAGTDSSGYGNVKVQGSMRKAHRVAFEMEVGPLGELRLRHRCDRPNCVRPAHLIPGSQGDNMRDSQRRNRRARARYPRKLTEATVYAIRERLEEGRSAGEVAKEFGISRPTVFHIKAGRIWRDCR